MPKNTLTNASSEKVIIKLPFTLPYSTDWQTPLEADGLLEIKGEFYTIIQKKLERDTLYFECLKNNHAQEIFFSFGNLANEMKQSTGNAQRQKQQNLLISILKQLFVPIDTLVFCIEKYIYIIENKLLHPLTNHYSSPFLYILFPPPQQ